MLNSLLRPNTLNNIKDLKFQGTLKKYRQKCTKKSKNIAPYMLKVQTADYAKTSNQKIL